MPKNATGGNKAKKRANKNAALREILHEPEGEQYIGLVTNYHGRGDCNLTYIVSQKDDLGREIITQLDVRGSIRGTIRKWVRTLQRGQLVLVSPRDYEKGVVDILTLYSQDHINRLKRKNLIDQKLLKLMNSLDVNKIKGEEKKGNDENEDEDDGTINFDFGKNDAIPSDKKKRVKNITDYSDLQLIPDDYDGDDWGEEDGEDGDPEIDFI